MNLQDELLRKWETGEQVLAGVQNVSNAPRISELAGRVGFDMVWLELEHGTACFETVETLCMATDAGGAIPVARVQDHQRTHILRTLETGARILLVPMIHNAEMAKEIVRYGKFPPIGERGFHGATRGLGYGLGSPLENFDKANRSTHLIAQIETVEALENLEEIVNVDGLSGIFVGPGDLSVALGCAAEFQNPRLHEAVSTAISKARATGKHAGLLGPPDLLKTGLQAGADFFFCGGDLANLHPAWTALLERARNGFPA